MPLALNVNWPEIRRAAELGGSVPKLSQTWGIKENTIWQRAHREKWLLPKRLQERLTAYQMGKANGVAGVQGGGVSSDVRDPLFLEKREAEKKRDSDMTEAVIAETWEERKDSIRQLAWSIGEKSLSKVKQSGVMVTDAGDLTKIVKVMREAAGFNDQTPAFSLSIFGSDTPDAIDTIHEMAPSYAEPITDSDDWA